MPRGVVLAAIGLAVVLTAAGCSQPKMIGGAPPQALGERFVYQPIERPSPRPAPTEPSTPRRSPLIDLRPALPDHDLSWEAPGPQRPWRWVVIHHSATHRGSAAIFDDWHRNGRHWDELGYHFVIGNGSASGNGQVEVGSRWPKQKHGAHCKVGEDETYNNYGIGICLVGNFEKARPTQAQMDSLARLVGYLAVRYKIDDTHILGHGDVDDTKCPGRYFPLENLLARLRAQRAARRGFVRGR